MLRRVRRLKVALVVVGAAIMVAGILGVILVSQAQANLAGQMYNECLANPASPACIGLGTQAAVYGMYWLLTVLLAGVGVIIMIVGLVVAAVSESAPVMAVPPQPYAYPAASPPVASTQTAPCIRCGRPARWVPGYNRWYCDAEQMYV